MKNPSKKLLLYLWVLMFSPIICHGQYDFIEFLSRESGMPIDKIADAATDSKGYLWLGTAQGLYRFDGLEFERFPLKSETDSVYLRNIYKIAIDQNDKIYCSFLNNGLGVFDPHTFELTHYISNPKIKYALPSNTVDYLVDADSLVFMILESNGFAIFNKSKKSFRHFLPSQFVDATRHPRANDLLTCTRDINQPSRVWICGVEGLYLFDTATKTLRLFPRDETPFPTATARCIYMHTDGRLYIGTWWDGILVFNTQQMRWEENILTDKDKRFDLTDVPAMAQGPGEEIWVQSRHGLLALRPQDKHCTLRVPQRDKNSPFESDQFWSLRAEAEQIIPIKDGSYAMIGGGMDGIQMYHSNQQLLRKIKTGTVVHYATFAKDGTQYLTTNEPFFFEKLPGESKLRKIPIEMKEAGFGIRDCFMDKQETLWLVGEKSLYRYHRGDSSAKPIYFRGIDSLVQQGKWMLSAFLDSKQRLWVGTNRELLVLDDLSSQGYRVGSFSDSLSGSQISWRQFVDFAETGQNRVWFACDRGFGYSDDGGKSFFRYEMDAKTDQPFEFVDFNAFALDKKGRLWVGSSGDGMIYLDPGRPHPQVMKVFRGNASGNQTDQISELKTDTEGNIWALSALGLFKIDQADLSVSYFGRAYGLLPAQVLTMASLPNDGLILGTLNGYYKFQPAALAIDRRFPTPQVFAYSYFTSIDEEIVYRSPNEIQLDYPYRSFDVSFGMPWFWDAKQIKFQYRLTGYHSHWVDVGSERSVFLGEIPPDSYTFELRSSNAAGEWSETNIVALPVRIVPAFWQTAWFRVLGLTLLIGAFFWAYFRRKIRLGRERALKAEYEEQLSRLELSALRAQINPHFIFNALNSLKWYIVKGEQERTVDYLDKFSLLMRKVLECSKREMITLTEELEIIALMLEIEQHRFKNKFEYQIEMEDGLDVHFLHIPPLLLQPYVENAIWHGLLHKTEGIGKLGIFLKTIPDGFQCIIEDNGIGREKAKELKSKHLKQTKSFGMQISEERIALLPKQHFQSAELQIEDLTNRDGSPAGTRVVISLCP
jgi:ligand-binding sensor domain-containing protein